MVPENNREADGDRNKSKSTQFKRTPDGVKTKRMLEVEDKIGTTLEDDYRTQYLYGDLGQKRLANRWGVQRALIFSRLPDGRRSWIQMLGLPKRGDASDKKPAEDARRVNHDLATVGGMARLPVVRARRKPSMMTKKLFLASSSELKSDREQFELFIGRKNNDWVGKNIFLQLILWEGFLDAMSRTRLQDEYNKAIQECDIFVILFSTKMGEYTEEEFETALRQFKATGKPHIFTYLKDEQISVASANRKDLMSLWAFEDKLHALGHYYTVYKNDEELKLKFGQQLDKLAAAGAFSSKGASGSA